MPRQNGPIRVLVVDDSALAREMVSELIEQDPALALAGLAVDGLDAVAKAASLKPDIIVMDIEMPVMNGLDAIEAIMAKNPTPILVLTSHTGVRVAFAAVSRGALDVVEKPDLDAGNGAKLIRKIKILANVDPLVCQKGSPRRASVPEPDAPGAPGGGASIVAIAASTGGPKALEQLLSRLPANFPAPIVVCQHMAAGFVQGMAEWLGSSTPLGVSAARKGDILAPGHVYLAPPESSMKITRQGVVLLAEAEPAQVYRPSCDALLGSVATAYGAKAVGVILTGMGDDGVTGIHAIKKAAGVTIAQDEATSIIYGMNGLAVKRGWINLVLPLSEIPAHLIRLTGNGAAKP